MSFLTNLWDATKMVGAAILALLIAIPCVLAFFGLLYLVMMLFAYNVIIGLVATIVTSIVLIALNLRFDVF